MTTNIVELPVAEVIPGDNDRTIFDPDKLAELAESIRQHGLAQPITVRPLGGKYQIIAGERRFRAISQVLKWEKVPAIVRELSDEDASAIMLAENTARADLNPIDEARAYQKRIEQFGWTVARIADVAGKSASVVKNRLELLNLVPELQTMVAKGQLDVVKAQMLTVLDANRQRMALRVMTTGKGELSVAALKAVVSDLFEQQSQEALFDVTQFWMEQKAEDRLVVNGTQAPVNVPTDESLPEVHAGKGIDTGTVMYDYLCDLVHAGRLAEAAAVGNLFKALIVARNISLPARALQDLRKK